MSPVYQSDRNQIAPWLVPLRESLDLESFPNAVLIHGQAGLGKFEFALELAKGLLCEGSADTQSKPCNHCEACHWFDSANHPDFTALVPETHRSLLPQTVYESEEVSKKGKTSREESDGEPSEKKAKKNISIEETRNVVEALSIGAHRGGNKVILIYPLENLRSDSANTLLKSLEEPPPRTIFILLADRLDRVLPTIRSRCRLLSIGRPDKNAGIGWLYSQITKISGTQFKDTDIESLYDEHGGAPYAVLDSLIARHNKDEKDELSIAFQASRQLLQSMSQGARIHWLEISEKIHKAQFAYLLATMQRWSSDLLTVAQGGLPRYYPKHIDTLQALSKQVSISKLLQYWKTLVQYRRHENHPLATRIQLEALLSQYQLIFEL